MCSGQHVFHNVAVDVSEAVVASGVAEGEAGVIDAEQMQDRGVEVVNMDTVFRDSGGDFIGAAVCHSAPDSSSGQP